MFESTLDSSWNERTRHGLTTLTSFGLQALAVVVLLIAPLLRPTGMPSFRELSTPISLGQAPISAPAVQSHARGNMTVTSLADNVLRLPPRIPHGVAASSDDAPPEVGDLGTSVLGGPGSSDQRGVANLFSSGTRPIIPVTPLAVAHPVRLSKMSEGDLIRKVLPIYPPLARSARIQGTVVLMAMISKTGAIENLRLLSGHPMLAPAAIEAVRQWRYRPYVLNNEPVEVETQITVNFSLAGN
jgi:periplasmic protein TonB